MKITLHFLVFALLAASCTAPPTRPGRGKGSANGETGGVGGGGGTGNSGGSGELMITFNTALPRLTHLEWENTVRDAFLLSAKPNLASKFSADDNSTIFHNDSNTNKVTSGLWKDYQEASEELGKRISADANQVKKLIPAGTPSGESVERAVFVLKPLLHRAYRRAADNSELNALANIYKDGKKLTGGKDFDASGLQAVTAAILQSPQFIYHPEWGTEGDKVAKLTPDEMAARLSYAIWKTIPDSELFEAAENGKLETPEEIKAQVARMIKDPKADQTVKYFVNELFETKKMVGLTKNKELYPKFPNDLGDTLKKEAEMFIDDVVLKNNGGITKLLTSSYTFVNDKTAPLYDVALPGTMDLTRVELDPKVRSGLVTQIGWLAAYATSERTSTIKRGFYVMNRLACDSLPPMVGSDSLPDQTFKTRRDEVHYKTGTCGAACHNNYINPPAFALEAFDASGVFRTKENNNPIDTSGTYGNPSDPDPQLPFKNAVELMHGIAKRKTTHECFVKRAIELLYNRRTNDLDNEIIARIGQESLDGLGTKDIMIELLSDIDLLSQRSDNE